MLNLHLYQDATPTGRVGGYLDNDGTVYDRPVQPFATVNGYSESTLADGAVSALAEWAEDWKIDENDGRFVAGSKPGVRVVAVHQTLGEVDAREYGHLLEADVEEDEDEDVQDVTGNIEVPDYDDLSAERGSDPLCTEIANVVRLRSESLVRDLVANPPTTESALRERFRQHSLI